MTRDDRVVNTGDRSSSEIRDDIDRTRSIMDSTVSAIEQKLTPAQLFDEAWQIFRNRSSSSEGPGMASRLIREHPLPMAVVGLGLGWLAAESIGGSSKKEEYPRTARGAPRSRTRALRPGERVHVDAEGRPDRPDDRIGRSGSGGSDGMMDSVKATAGEVRDRAAHMKDKASEAGHRVSDMTHSASDTLGDLGERVRERAHDLREGVEHTGERLMEGAERAGTTARRGAQRARSGLAHAMEENPIRMGVAAFAAGVAAGFSLPTTRWEDEAMGETRDSLIHDVRETGREAVEETAERAAHVATAAAEGAIHEAERQDLTPSGIGESIRQVAREAKESAKEQAEKEGMTPGQIKEKARETGASASEKSSSSGGRERKEGGSGGGSERKEGGSGGSSNTPPSTR